MNFLTNQEQQSTKTKPKVLFESEYIKVLDIWGYKAIQENDMVICLPYIVEKNTILLKYDFPFLKMLLHAQSSTNKKVINPIGYFGCSMLS